MRDDWWNITLGWCNIHISSAKSLKMVGKFQQKIQNLVFLKFHRLSKWSRTFPSTLFSVWKCWTYLHVEKSLILLFLDRYIFFSSFECICLDHWSKYMPMHCFRHSFERSAIYDANLRISFVLCIYLHILVTILPRRSLHWTILQLDVVYMDSLKVVPNDRRRKEFENCEIEYQWNRIAPFYCPSICSLV